MIKPELINEQLKEKVNDIFENIPEDKLEKARKSFLEGIRKSGADFEKWKKIVYKVKKEKDIPET